MGTLIILARTNYAAGVQFCFLLSITQPLAE
jgi:hypothetical protein